MTSVSLCEDVGPQSLELRAILSLSSGDAFGAFELADRRCRLSLAPEAHSYLLRAEALNRLDQRAAAVADVASALRIAPDDLNANRRMLAWGAGPQKTQAAQRLIGLETNANALMQAINCLRSEGVTAFASLTILEDSVEGWALAEDDDAVAVTIDDGVETKTIFLDTGPTSAGRRTDERHRFVISLPPSPRMQSISVVAGGRVLCRRQAPGRQKASLAPPRPITQDSHSEGLTVVVPIYADYEATRTCLECLQAELAVSPNCRALLVNDASPDARIARYLDAIADSPRIRVLTNSRNLGYVGSVNRALENIPDGDVLLLNSDAIPPIGLTRRLAAAASSASDIGMAMPLSNNADLASFPSPFVAHPAGSREEIEALDRIAAEVNAGQVVDIPNGIGFCLYITRACLNATGPLSEDFSRGYLEDVDHSLRARACGFRTICAPSVYVGHAGTKSFGAEKQALVIRNLEIVRAKYPRYGMEFASFAAADPLKASRQAIARRLHPRARHVRLLVSGAGAVGEVARSRGRKLASEGQPVLTLEVKRGARGPYATVSTLAGGAPYATRFDVSLARECDALVEFLQASSVQRIEIFDPLHLPFALFERLRRLAVPYDIVIADAGLLGQDRAASLSAANLHCSDHGRGLAEKDTQGDNWRRRWQAIVAEADSVLAIDERARAFGALLLPGLEIRDISGFDSEEAVAASRRDIPAPGRIALLPARRSALELRLMIELARAFQAARPSMKCVVIGETLDDGALMRIGNMHVTGTVSADELETIMRRYRIDSVFCAVARPLFGHPMLSAAFRGPRPVAYFDWAPGALEPRGGDLPLQPILSAREIARELLRWSANAA
jgi:O-antigen biosynthesis protein